MWESNILIIFGETPRQSNNFAWDWHPSRYFFVFNNFFYPEVSWKGRGCEGLRVKKQCLLSWWNSLWRSGWKQRSWQGGQRRSPVMSHVSVHKDVVRLTFDHACFQSKFMVTVWKDVGRRDQPMNPRNGTNTWKVTNSFTEQYTLLRHKQTDVVSEIPDSLSGMWKIWECEKFHFQ
jgi:hypothetical protein